MMTIKMTRRQNLN